MIEFPSSFRLRFGSSITLGRTVSSFHAKSLIESIRGNRILYKFNEQFLFPLYGCSGTVTSTGESILYDPADDGDWRRDGEFGQLQIIRVEQYNPEEFTFIRYPGGEILGKIASA